MPLSALHAHQRTKDTTLPHGRGQARTIFGGCAACLILMRGLENVARSFDKETVTALHRGHLQFTIPVYRIIRLRISFYSLVRNIRVRLSLSLSLGLGRTKFFLFNFVQHSFPLTLAKFTTKLSLPREGKSLSFILPGTFLVPGHAVRYLPS